MLGFRFWLGLRLKIGLGVGLGIGVGLGLGLGIGIADLKLSILAPVQIADLNLTLCFSDILTTTFQPNSL